MATGASRWPKWRAAERSHERRQNILRAIGLGGAAFVTGKDTAAEPDPAAEVIDAAPDLPEETAALMIRAMILPPPATGRSTPRNAPGSRAMSPMPRRRTAPLSQPRSTHPGRLTR